MTNYSQAEKLRWILGKVNGVATKNALLSAIHIMEILETIDEESSKHIIALLSIEAQRLERQAAVVENEPDWNHEAIACRALMKILTINNP